MTEPWTFGVEPLGQTADAAALLRRVTGLILALEGEDDEVARLIADLERAERVLATHVPPEPQPRVGPAADGDGRLYVDHARDIGAFNPAFPEYELQVDGALASGTVTFPLVYEGPPGIVHGGFLAVFFDCVVQHHNCDVGVAGKTTSLALRFKRPAPIGVPLSFTIDRRVDGDRIRSTAVLRDGDRVVCEADVDAIAGDRTNLPAVSPRAGTP